MNHTLDLDKLSTILKTISHPVKLDILLLLKDYESLNVQEIQEKLGCNCEQSMLSHHLIKMKDKGVVISSKNGKYNSYSLVDRNILKIFDCFENCNLEL